MRRRVRQAILLAGGAIILAVAGVLEAVYRIDTRLDEEANR